MPEQPTERVMGTTRMPASLHVMFADIWRSFCDGLGGYHPERHYMRGPGPKWREKHGFSEQATPPWVLTPASAAGDLGAFPRRAELG